MGNYLNSRASFTAYSEVYKFVFSVYALFMFIIDGYFGIGIKDPWNRFKDWRNRI